MEATECPKKTQPTKTSSKPTINAPRWTDLPIVQLIGWVFEVPQVAAEEERSVLWYASDGLSGEMGCLGKPAFTRRAQVRQIGANEERSVLTLRKRRVNAKVACLSYAEGSCWVMQWILPPPKTTCSD